MTPLESWLVLLVGLPMAVAVEWLACHAVGRLLAAVGRKLEGDKL